MKYLTRFDHEKLEALFRVDHSQEYIANIIGYNQSIVNCEIKRNCSPKQKRYTARTAQNKTEERKRIASLLLPRCHDDQELLPHVIGELVGRFQIKYQVE
ncbi:hypothetical protein IPN35_01195 [Candidatus Peregrinibacteria bacterium]|nr:MAG: hypothetical protein IPN35_01195 [Candidatus Peregrinibacteria bacterium]